jgi:hypothetical protein
MSGVISVSQHPAMWHKEGEELSSKPSLPQHYFMMNFQLMFWRVCY